MEAGKTQGFCLKSCFAHDKNNIGISFFTHQYRAHQIWMTMFFLMDDFKRAAKQMQHLPNLIWGLIKKWLVPVLKTNTVSQSIYKNIGLTMVSAGMDEKQIMKQKAAILKPEYYNVYAQYFVKYIQAMEGGRHYH